MKRTYFFNLLKMKMLSIRLIISVFYMVFMNFLVVMPDIRAIMIRLILFICFDLHTILVLFHASYLS